MAAQTRHRQHGSRISNRSRRRHAAPARPPEAPPRRSRRLRTTLIAVDAACAGLAWVTAYLAPTSWFGGVGVVGWIAVLWGCALVAVVLAAERPGIKRIMGCGCAYPEPDRGTLHHLVLGKEL